MNRISIICLVSCFAIAAAACGSAPPPQAVYVAPAAVDNFSGHWRGLADLTSVIPNSPTQMDVSTTIVNDGQCGSFEYGAIACSGSWSCGSTFDSQVMVITETIRYGNERCPNGARVELRTTNDPNQLQFIYQSAGVSATGTLNRGDSGN